ncbi:unannotated protein [freshwater metagenome]|uniref:Unannotated protein n=1 Tax=freshwater metagenome TaxID=449393 RepID=A0A6J6GHS2_9ZZZZ|nr:hypothetical protein [Actinomycetota bacterium]
MKFQRGAILTGLIAAILLVTNLFDASTNSRQYSNSYPSVVCPPNPAGVTTISSLASKKTLFYRIGNKSTKLVNINTLRYSTVTDPILIESKGLTPVTYQSRSGVWAGSVLCTSPTTSQWFAGGTSDVSSKGMLYLVNSGLSLSIVDIFTWSEKGEQSLKTISIKANSTSSIKLDSLAPGDASIVVNVVARSGRVNSFLIDERGKGLQKLGGDSVNGISTPTKKIVITGIPQQLVKNKVPEHYLRLFVPGVADANFTLELLSSDGRFIPIGYNERKLSSGKVVELKLKPKVAKGEFAIKITSDQPLVAAIRSRATSNGHSDFVWSTPSPALGPMQIAVSGIAPKIIFAGDAIAVDLKIQNSSGDIKDKSITGSDLVTWQVPNNTIAITVINAGKDNYAGALISAKSGYAFFPIASGAELTKAAIPSSNIQVLNP